MRQFAVARHVFLCVDGEYVVLLDLRQDRYWALEAASTRRLAGIIGGWPVGTRDQVSNAATLDVMEEVRLLAEKGLICDDVGAGKDATPLSLGPLVGHVLPDESGGRVRNGAGDALSFLLAVARADARIRCCSLEQVVSGVRCRKERADRKQHFDMEHAERLVTTFARLRPLLFSAREACLFSSLALIELFARHQLFPQWVFGVQARPFAAHCWVQQDGVLFNDTVEHVGRYTPIMAI